MASGQVTKQHTFKFRGSVQPELLNMIPYKPQAYDLPQDYQLDTQNKFKDQDILLKTNNVIDNVINTPNTDILNQNKSRMLQPTGSTIYWSQIKR